WPPVLAGNPAGHGGRPGAGLLAGAGRSPDGRPGLSLGGVRAHPHGRALWLHARPGECQPLGCGPALPAPPGLSGLRGDPAVLYRRRVALRHAGGRIPRPLGSAPGTAGPGQRLSPATAG
ncbi:hypothetical protein COLO4_02057, partial [Corchorus olitorius]